MERQDLLRGIFTFCEGKVRDAGLLRAWIYLLQTLNFVEREYNIESVKGRSGFMRIPNLFSDLSLLEDSREAYISPCFPYSIYYYGERAIK